MLQMLKALHRHVLIRMIAIKLSALISVSVILPREIGQTQITNISTRLCQSPELMLTSDQMGFTGVFWIDVPLLT